MKIISILDLANFGIWSRVNSIIDDSLNEDAKTLPQLIENAFANYTSKKYKPAWLKWLEWASKFDKVNPSPANPLHVALYINDIVTRDQKVGALTSAVLGIR